MESPAKMDGKSETDVPDGTLVESQALDQLPEMPVTSLDKKVENVEEDSYPKFDDMKRSKVFVILVSLGLASLLYAIEQTIVATSISVIGEGVHAKGSLAWITTSYLLTATAIQPVTGRLADAIGILRFLTIELWIFIIGNIIAGTSKSLVQLIAGRLISGVGGAGLLSLAVVLLSHLTNERQRGTYLNLINVVFIVSDAIGPLIGGGFARSGLWRWIFLFNAPFGPVITFILWKTIKLPQSPYQRQSFVHGVKTLDIGGMITLIATLTFFMIGLNVGGQSKPWNSPLVIGMFCATGVAFVIFVIVENKAKEPIAPPRLFTQWKWRNVPLAMVLRTLLFFHLYASSFYLPIFLQVIGVSLVTSTALATPFLSMAAVSSIIANYAAYRWGHIRTFILVSNMILPVGMGLLSTLDQTATIGRVVGYSILAGFGFGISTQLSVVAAQVGLPTNELSTVTSLLLSVPNLSGVLGISIIGNVINNTFRSSLLKAAPSAATLDLNDVVHLVRSADLPAGVARSDVVRSFVKAWRVGCYVLTGVAVVQLALSLLLRRITLDGGKEGGESNSEEKVSEKQP